MQHLVVLNDTVCAHVGGRKISGTLAPLPLGMGRGWPPLKHAPPQSPHVGPMCGEERVGRSRSQRMGIGQGPQNFVGRWGPAPENGERVWLETCFSRPTLPCQIWSFSVKSYQRKMEMRQKRIWSVASRLWRTDSLEPTQSAPYDFPVMICSNHGPVVYRFRDKRRFR